MTTTPRLIALLKLAKCPDCSGSGEIPRKLHDGTYKTEQCSWCADRNELIGEKDEMRSNAKK